MDNEVGKSRERPMERISFSELERKLQFFLTSLKSLPSRLEKAKQIAFDAVISEGGQLKTEQSAELLAINADLIQIDNQIAFLIRQVEASFNPIDLPLRVIRENIRNLKVLKASIKAEPAVAEVQTLLTDLNADLSSGLETQPELSLLETVNEFKANLTKMSDVLDDSIFSCKAYLNQLSTLS